MHGGRIEKVSSCMEGERGVAGPEQAPWGGVVGARVWGLARRGGQGEGGGGGFGIGLKVHL
jgi:hypothetical protein